MLESVLKRVLQAVFGGGADVDLPKLLRTLVEASVDTGVADDTSLVSRLDDSAKSWPVDAFTNLIVELTGGTCEGQIRKIASNTATSLVPVTNFDTAPDSTSTYRIGFFGKMASDITAWGGTAQTGLDIGTELPKKVNKATTPVIYNVTMTLADTEYSQALPANTKKYTIQTRDGTAFRMAFETLKVALPTEPYLSIGTDGFHHEDLIEPASLTLFFGCGEALKVIEILAWS